MGPQWLLDQISAKADVQLYVVSQERHEDGGYHLHAYFKFSRKLDTRDSSFFDVKYYRMYHPNIAKVTSLPLLLKYIKKAGDYLENFDSRPVWLQLMEDSDSKPEFLENLMWRIGRFDNYAGYRTLRDLYDMKHERARIRENISNSSP